METKTHHIGRLSEQPSSALNAEQVQVAREGNGKIDSSRKMHHDASGCAGWRRIIEADGQNGGLSLVAYLLAQKNGSQIRLPIGEIQIQIG